MKKGKQHTEMRESSKRELDRLVDSLDFEPVNFYEVMARIRHLMCHEYSMNKKYR